MGCGETLFLGEGGYVTCSLVGCPRPTAASEILEDGETEHVVQIEGVNWHLRHPLKERLDDAMFTCKVAHSIAVRGGPSVEPGRYRVVRGTDGALTYTEAKA